MLTYQQYINKKLILELQQKYADNLADINNTSFNDLFGNAYRIVIPFEDGKLSHIKNTLETRPGISVDITNGTVTEKGKTNQGRPYQRVHRLAAYIQKNYPYLFDDYNKAASRFKKGEEKISQEYAIVLSRHPIDIARMSDHSNITSCHSQGDSYFHCALEEANNGPIAYVLKKTDLEKIKNILPTEQEIFADPERDISGVEPVARIRVRKFINEKDEYDLAIPETRKYGKKIDGFQDSLNDWLYEKQKDKFGGKPPKMKDFVRTGGSYQDSQASVLFNAFFGQTHYAGDVKFKGDSEYNLYQQYQDEIDAIDKEFGKFKNPVWAHAEIENDYNEPYIFFDFGVDFSFPAAVVINFKNSDVFIKELLKLVRNYSDVFPKEIEVSRERNGLEVRYINSTDSYDAHPDGYRKLMQDAQEIDEKYNHEYNVLYNILSQLGVLTSPLQNKNLNNLKFRNFEVEEDEYSGTFKIFVPSFKIGDLKGIDPVGFDVDIDKSPLFLNYKRMIISTIANQMRNLRMSFMRQKTFPGLQPVNVFDIGMKNPTIKFDYYQPFVYMELGWEIPMSMQDIDIAATIKLLHSLDDGFDRILAHIVRSFWIYIKSKYKFNIKQEQYDDEEEVEIRGEYWIDRGSIHYADGDIGDATHESLAIEAVFSSFNDGILQLAKQLKINTSRQSYDINTEQITNLLELILEQMPENEVAAELGANQDAMLILQGGGDAELYVMAYDGWIAVRGNNVSFFGWDENKRKSLVNGLNDILESEGIDYNIPPENIEFSMFDAKTNRSSYATLADLEQVIQRPVQPLMSKGHSKFNITNSDTQENQPATVKSQPNPTNLVAQQSGMIGPGQQFWRGTSENVE